MRKQTPEQALQRLVMDWLAANRILAFRMNSGAVLSGHNGKQRMVRYGVKGMADVLAFVKVWSGGRPYLRTLPVWIEFKSPSGRQTPEQRSFQEQVVRDGHIYILARSLEDVQEVLR